MREMETSHFWVGRFPEALAASYFVERHDQGHDGEETPLSAFAHDQGEKWFDHDFLEYGYSNTAGSVEELIARHSYSDQWAAEFNHRVMEAGLTGVNWFAFISVSEISEPRSVQGDGYWVHYLGAISYRI